MKRIVLAAFLTLTSLAYVFGQQHTENKSDQALRGSGRVNPSTLGMEINIPLGSYPGRGINVPISLSYSSKLWRMDYSYDTEGGIITGGCRSVNEAKYSENAASGWTTSLATPYIEYTGKNNLFNDHGFPLGVDLCPHSLPNYYQNAYVRRLTINLPSGETHELRADDTPQIYPPSSACPPSGGYSCDPNDPSLQANWNRTYYAVDGSNIRYIEDSNTSTYRLQMPDGSFYDFVSTLSWEEGATIRKAVKFTDRNGNFTSYNAVTGAWTDTLGRTLTAPFGKQAPSAPTMHTYTMPGMTGEYKFHWKLLKGASAVESGLTDFNQNLKYRGPHVRATSFGNWELRPENTYLFYSEFEHYVLSGSAVFNPVVLTEIELPTGQRYKFSYDIYGLIEKITYPTGGEEKFTYHAVAPLTQSEPGNISDQTNFGVTNRKVYETAGQGTPYEWNYSAFHVAPSGYKVSVISPDQTMSQRFLHQGNACIGCDQGSFDNGLAGMPYQELAFDNSDPRKLVSRKLTHWTKKSFGNADWHPRVTHAESIVYDADGNGVSATVKYEYAGDLDQRWTHVLVSKTKQYAFVPIEGGGSITPVDPDEDPEPSPTPIPTPIPPTPVKIVETTHLFYDQNIPQTKRDAYWYRNMLGLVTVSKVRDGANNIVSESYTVYDDTTNRPLIPAGTSDQWQDPNTNYRGNPNTATVWDSTKGASTNQSAYILTHAQFDNFGNQRKAWDAKGNMTETEYSSDYGFAFPTRVITPIPDPSGLHGSNTSFITETTYNVTTGLPLTTKDANNQVTTLEYDPVTLRPKKVIPPAGAGISETFYHDEPNNYWVKSRAQIDTDKWAESITYFDGLGRAWKSEEVNSQGNIFVEKEFDAEGRVKRVTNPFRANEVKHWTTNVYDEASRVKEVILPDGATVETDYGVSIAASVGVTKQITDQAGKKRKGITDALGRMIRVIEDPTGQNLPTDYVFDTLGNLRKTIQGEQSRYFMHDSLGRLLYAKQPEQDANPNFSGPIYTDYFTGNNQWSTRYYY